MTLRLVDPGADEAAEEGLQLLDRRAVTEAAMREYLAQRGFGTAAIEDAVAAFTARGWLDDGDYACEMLRQYAFKAGQSRARLRAQMEKKGLDKSLIEQALSQLDQDEPQWEYDNARRFALSKYAGNLSGLDFGDRQAVTKFRQKIWRGLASRGFCAETCQGIAMEILDQET